MGEIVIGKHTLESLTTGMYSDPFVVYREYIQNAADSIDEAIAAGQIKRKESRILITVNAADRTISIWDNGTGVSSDSAESTLVSIGNSKKTNEMSRGFRGIGRLAALSYCSKITFRTTSADEPTGTKITIDAHLLSELLLSETNADNTLTDVLQKVYSVSHFPAEKKAHYFEVIAEGVDPASGLVNYDDIVDYISQTVPVPYNDTAFPWGKEIRNRLRREGITISSYDIHVSDGARSVKVYKPYKSKFLVDKNKDIWDQVTDIEILRIGDGKGGYSAIGWIGKIGYRGSIWDKSVKGIRLRKGNILIGDGQTLNSVFKDSRFNGWTVGELFAVSPELLPNARRDNFEKNDAYYLLMENLRAVAKDISKDIRVASLARNRELADAVQESERIVQNASAALDNGLLSSQKGSLSHSLANAKKAIESAATDSDGEYYQGIAFEELDLLIGKVQGATTFKALNTFDHLTKMEKKILERVFNILLQSDIPNPDGVIDTILDGYKV